MDWQQFIALTIVAVTIGCFLAATRSRKRRRTGMEAHCGCAGAGVRGRPPRVILKGRKGEKPTMHVKMQ